MEDVGVQVGAVWPNDCPQLLIHPHLPEELRILAQRLEDRAPEVVCEINLAGAPIVEAKPKSETLPAARRSGSGLSWSWCSWQWLNRIEGNVRRCLRPVRL